jgi:hypothetical protein
MLHSGRLVTFDAFASTYDRIAEQTICPGWTARLGARLRGHALDRALIAGSDPSASPQLAARAGLLTTRQRRNLVAGAIERLVAATREPASWARITPRRASVRSQESELRELAGLLRSPSPVYARGIAMLDTLVRDGAGPAFYGEPAALRAELRAARAALAG